MPQVMILCPETRKPIYTGLNLDWCLIDALDLGENSIACPECGKDHSWTTTDTFLRADGGGD